MDNNYLIILLPLISAIISSWLTYLFTIKINKSENMLKFKEEKYANLLIHLQGFVGKTSNGDTKKKFFEEEYKSWLYAPDGVVKSINNLVELLITERGNKPNPKKGKEVVGNIVLEMRKDLLGKTNLKNSDFKYIDVIE